MRRLLLAALIASPALLGGCVWVKMAPGAQQVRVASITADLSACQRRGEIAVSVKDSITFYQRNQLKVRDELETLARNESVGLGADTIQPKSEPVDGEQRWLAFVCGNATGAARPAARTAREGDAETFPIDDR